MINSYEMITQLGRGQHGEVWYSKNTLTSQVVVRQSVSFVGPLCSDVVRS